MSNQENMSIDDAMATGDPDIIEEVMALESSKQDESAQATVEVDTGSVFESEQTKSTEVETKAVEEPEGEPSGPQDKKVLKSKDGKHEIPYSVLEQERKANEDLRRQNKELLQQKENLKSKAQEHESSLNNVKARLEAEGMNVETMLSNPDEISEEQLVEFGKEYGEEMGKFFRQLVKGQKNIQDQIQSKSESPKPDQDVKDDDAVFQAISENTDLSSWQKNDPDRWAEAIRIDNELRKDPAWDIKPLDERFLEVAKQTKQSFGESAEDRAKKIIDKTEQPAPDSLSDIGHSPTRVKTAAESFEGMSAEQIESRMETMSASELDSVLAGGF